MLFGHAVVSLPFAVYGGVAADTPEAAEMAALNLLRYEDTFAPPAGHARSKDARVYFEKIEAVSGPQTEGGASWFPMDA